MSKRADDILTRLRIADVDQPIAAGRGHPLPIRTQTPGLDFAGMIQGTDRPTTRGIQEIAP